MRDGRLIFTTEKRAPGFYQLAGRRMNLDGGDYHPLFGQRGTVGFNQFTDVVELADKNLAAIMSERGAAHGAGTLASSTAPSASISAAPTPADYVQDPTRRSTTRTRSSTSTRIRIFDTAATGRLSATQGAYRSPAPLAERRLARQLRRNVVALDSFDGNFDIVVVNPAPAIANR